jgi:hypothetical protein
VTVARRSLLALAIGVLVSTAAPVPGAATRSAADLSEVACSLPHQWLLRTWRGWTPDRGAELQFLPHEPDYVGSGLPHVGPWDYVQDVPMFWYGPGYIAPRGSVERPVTLAGIAPTQAALLGFPFDPPDGQPMTEALSPEVLEGKEPPRLIVTIVWDAAGRNVLDEWPDAWPYLRSLIPRGTWFENATVGSTPTSTAQDHATIGTGSFPNHHMLIAHRMRISQRITTPWAMGPAFLNAPTLADLYDRAMGNRSLVATVATVNIHFGMMSHGAFFSGGDRDIAMTRSVVGGETITDEGFEWNMPANIERYYELPPYLNDIPGFDRDVRAIDAADGAIDGRWRDNEIDQLLGGFDTPARIPYQQRVLETVVEEEGFGADDVPDLLFANFKEIDYISHVWTMNSLEMRDAVAWQDAALKDLVRFLNDRVGRGRWVLVLTADHGAIPDPEVSGAFNLSTGAIAAQVNARFDPDGDETRVVELVQPTQMFVSEAELRQNGGTVEEVARFLLTLTKSQVAGPEAPPDPAEAGAPALVAAFPSSLMLDLPCLPEARE